jgi:NADP-dependent 3-hydroxy acid dehydrogenase YdfG
VTVNARAASASIRSAAMRTADGRTSPLAWVLITGGTSGTGLATARLLLDRGSRIVITGRDDGKLAWAVDELKSGREDPDGVMACARMPRASLTSTN